MADPLSGPAALVGSLWGTYGPMLIAGSAAFMRQSTSEGAPFGLNTSAQSRPAPRPQPSRLTTERRQTSDTQSMIDRRRQLEEELAALERMAVEETSSPAVSSLGGIGSPPIAATDSNASALFSPGLWSRASSGSGTSEIRQRNGSDAGSRFEEVEVPSDIEDEQARQGRPGAGQ
jgi:receptor expression-enhancing protein 1/2/3/4